METLAFVILVVLLWHTGGFFFRVLWWLLFAFLFFGVLRLLVPSGVFWTIVAIIVLSAVWQAALAVAEERRAQDAIRRRMAEAFRHPSWPCHVCGARIDPRIERCPSCGTALAGTPKQRMAQALAERERIRLRAELACLEESRHRTVSRQRTIC